MVDSQGLVLHACVHRADLRDRRAAEVVLAGLNAAHPDIVRLFGDMAYQGLAAWLSANLGWQLRIVKRPRRWAWVGPDQEPADMPAGFSILPRRWVVERTLAWLSRTRRLARDWEGLSSTTKTWICLAMSRLMAKRRAHATASIIQTPSRGGGIARAHAAISSCSR